MFTKVLTAALLLIFFAVMTGIGLYCRRHATDVNGFVLGGRSVGPWLSAFAFGTSYFSAVVFVGYAGQFGWNFGLASTWIGLGNAFIGSLLAWVVLGRRTRIMTQHLSTKTMPDFFCKRFDSKALKIAASFIVFVFLIPYTASLYNGLSSLFHIAFDIPYWVVIAVMAGLTGLYVIFGGYMATAINDFIQGIIMLGGIIVVVAAVLADNGGLSQSIISLSQVDAPEAGALEGAYSSLTGPQPFYLLIVVLLTSLGTWGLPQMVGKFYSIKNEDAIKKGTIISTIFAIIVSGGCYFLGGFGRLYDSPALYDASGNLLTDSIIPTMLSKMPGVIIAIVVVLVLSASMSTLSSLVLTSSSTLTLDVILPMRKKETKEKTQLFILRLFIVFFIIVSAVLAILKDTYNFSMIAQMMGVSWGALAGSFLAPFLYGLYWKRTTKASVAVSFLFSSCLMVVQMLISMGVFTVEGGILGLIFRNSLYSGVFAMVGGLVLVPLISLLTPKMEKKKVDAMFTCYGENVVVKTTKSLGN
ncbi:MAG: sodium:solute symporter [Clostridiales bacterium]|nr:sodium:solute symporter [Clostridiales bacterium]